MYGGNPPSASSKPHGVNSVASKWGTNSTNNPKPAAPSANNKTFLHKSPGWPPKPQEESNDSPRNFPPKKPWEANKPELKKPWEKEKDNNFKNTLNGNAKFGSNEQNNNSPSTPWGPKKNDVKKSPSFNSKPNINNTNQEDSSLHKRPSLPASGQGTWLAKRQQQLNNSDQSPSSTQEANKPVPSAPTKPSWLKQQNQPPSVDTTKAEESIPPWKAVNSSVENKKKSFNAPSAVTAKPIVPKKLFELGDQTNDGDSSSTTKPSSFLFRNKSPKPENSSTNAPPINQSSSAQRKKRLLPADIYQRPPPQKPRRPPHARLPDQNTRKNSSPMATQSLVPPPLPGSKPGGDFPPPPSPSKLRNLPIVPANKPVPAAISGDDIYDDTDSGPLPPPLPPSPMRNATEDIEEIPTWDDEDEGEALYDLTPGEFPPTEIPEEGGEEMYEDLDQYSKFKGPSNANSNPENAKPIKAEEKSKKELKKEKAARKKFSLPMDGDISAECIAYARSEVKGSNKLNLSVNEVVEVIRRNNNPKGKWLVRTEIGTYGYVDSENLSFELYDRRSTTLPPGPPPSLPPARIPTMSANEEEIVYDDTGGEELYEEL